MRKRKIPTPPETFDEPWKQIVTALFQPFMEFFAPQAAVEIDWNRQPVFLNKELRRIAKGFNRRRKSTADFLVQVWRTDGSEHWLVIHIELQAQREAVFPERMFLYNVRGYDLYRRPIASLAILADTSPAWRPDRFGYSAWGSHAEVIYPVVKLLDYRDRTAELERSANPFALAVLAHLNTQETRGDAEARLAAKTQLARMLFTRKWTRLEVEELLQFFDWVMTLPVEQEDAFEIEYDEMERTETMAEKMSPLLERKTRRAEANGVRTILLRLGRKRLGEPTEMTVAAIEAITDIDRLHTLCERVVDIENWDDLFIEA